MTPRRAVRVEGLAARLAPAVWDGRVPDLLATSFVRNLIQLRFAEADFNVRVGPQGPAGLELALEAVFRERGQESCAGGTWWDTWKVTVPAREDAARRLVDEVVAARRRFAVLLAEARRAA
ncbi:hypothetical protein ABT160_39510 [Streptomyces sp. NPDC001941]|uniref:hypothetical protein n=1 Tax=Streptomyces sp. NPDC001941 TaxID=3154659 RepID=UPI0033347B2F